MTVRRALRHCSQSPSSPSTCGLAVVLTTTAVVIAQPETKPQSSANARAKFNAIVQKMTAEKPGHMSATRAHLEERYDMSNRASRQAVRRHRR